MIFDACLSLWHFTSKQTMKDVDKVMFLFICLHKNDKNDAWAYKACYVMENMRIIYHSFSITSRTCILQTVYLNVPSKLSLVNQPIN